MTVNTNAFIYVIIYSKLECQIHCMIVFEKENEGVADA